jgi:hypothetical protein
MRTEGSESTESTSYMYIRECGNYILGSRDDNGMRIHVQQICLLPKKAVILSRNLWIFHTSFLEAVLGCLQLVHV